MKNTNILTGILILTESVLVSLTDMPCNEPGWFGPDCRFKCFCKSKKCDNQGNCPLGDGCEKHKFGVGCQYKSHDNTNTINFPLWSMDWDLDTCNPYLSSTLTILDYGMKFTFLIYTVRNSSFRDEPVSVSFGWSGGCTNLTRFVRDSRSVEVHCDPTVLTLNAPLTLSGEGVKYICEVIVNYGRNVAVKESVTLVSNGIRSSPWVTVDGERTAFTYPDGNSCVLTENGGTLTITFQEVVFIDHICVYRSDAPYVSLLALDWTVLDKSGRDVEHGTFRKGRMDCIAHFNRGTGIKELRISNDKIINVCEVEVYGGHSCEKGRYGLECERNCSGCPNGDCYSSTGACKGPCPAGTQYLGCTQECDNGMFGINCSQKCPPCPGGYPCHPKTGLCECFMGFYGRNCSVPCKQGCANSVCNKTTGECFNCKAGFRGRFCDKECGYWTYGFECQHWCSARCVAGTCDKVTGECQCVTGYHGPHCQEACGAKTYGLNCSSTCSSHCRDNMCNGTTGECFNCGHGFTGNNCALVCPRGRYGEHCAYRCPTGCLIDECNMTTGACQRCLPSRTGPHCDLAPIAADLFIAVFVLGLLVALFIVGFQRCKKCYVGRSEMKVSTAGAGEESGTTGFSAGSTVSGLAVRSSPGSTLVM